MTTVAEGGPARVEVRRDGLRIAALDWGGDGPPLVLLHANGFCAGVFEPLVGRLEGRFRAVAVDLRGAGATDVPTAPEAFSFEAMAADVVAVLDEVGITEAVAVGQSLGGSVAILVDRLRPGLFRRLLLCEAIAFPPGWRDEGPGPLAAAARRRRRVWPDRETMIRSYGSRPPLHTLAPEALDAYVRWGTVERPDGQVELACPPEAEATIFETSVSPVSAPAAWEHLASLTAEAVIAAGAGSDLPTERFAGQAHRAGAPLRVVPGTHFFLQEDTAAAAALVERELARPG